MQKIKSTFQSTHANVGMQLLLYPIASSLKWPLTCLDAGKRTFLRMKSATEASKLLVIPFDPLLETATSLRLKVSPKSVKLKREENFFIRPWIFSPGSFVGFVVGHGHPHFGARC
jgi:hypothetical protein